MKWNQEEFIAYLLIYASYADGKFVPEERQMILDKVSQESFHNIMVEFSLDSATKVSTTLLRLGERN